MFWNVLYATGGILVSSLGGAAIIFGLSAWLGKVWAERLLEEERARHRRNVEEFLESVKDTIQRGQFVHRLQFETEFELYRTLWEKTFEVRDAAVSLRPILDVRPKDKSDSEINEERLVRLSEAFKAYQSDYRKAEPFLAPVVYEAMSKLSKSIHSEAIDFSHGQRDRSTRDYWDQAQQNAKEITKQADSICSSIRERIGLMSEELVETAQGNSGAEGVGAA